MGAGICTNANSIAVAGTQINKHRNFEDEITDKDTSPLKASNGKREHEKLWAAVEINNYHAAELYLDFNEINENSLYDSLGQSILHLAAGLGHAELLMLLIERTGVKPDIVNNCLATPLHLACRNNRVSVVKFLIGCGVDANLQDEYGQTCTLVCCIHGHNEILSILIEASNSGHLAEPIEIDLPNHQGLTPLNCAAIRGDFPLVKNLVDNANANVDLTSPKGCTPLIYAGRGGFCDIVEYLLKHKASPLKQDHTGGTVFHHTIEKGHIAVLEVMTRAGVDVCSAIEIADNEGRTPIFEILESMTVGENSDMAYQVISTLVSPKDDGGYGANVNVVNYQGQSLLFIAVRQAQLEIVKLLVEAGAEPDLHNGELLKYDDTAPTEYENEREKNLYEAFKLCETPAQLAAVLGYEDILLYLVQECESDINLQTKSKGFTAIHLGVMANRFEILMELLTRCGANPMIEDKQGRTFLDMVYQYMPSYVTAFQTLLETLQVKTDNVIGYIQDEREINGAADEKQLYEEQGDQQLQQNSIDECMEISDDMEMEQKLDSRIEEAFGSKVAIWLLRPAWQQRQSALKRVIKATQTILQSGVDDQTLTAIVQGALVVVSQTCLDKVVKVFNNSVKLFNIVAAAQAVFQSSSAVKIMVMTIEQEAVAHKMLARAEQSNTRTTFKICDFLIDLAKRPEIGEYFLLKAIFDQISGNQQGSHKALIVEMNLLLKACQQFTVHTSAYKAEEQKNLLCWYTVLEVVLPSYLHHREEVRNMTVKVLEQVQKKTGLITLADLDELPEKARESLWCKLSAVTVTQQLQAQEQAAKVTLDKLQKENYDTYRSVISEKGTHKDWTQREIALQNMQECLSYSNVDLVLDETEFQAQCAGLISQSLDDNNKQIYLLAVECAAVFFKKFPQSQAVLDHFEKIMKSIATRVSDTNTRIKQRSHDVIGQNWDLDLGKASQHTASQTIAGVLTDSALNDKAIVGRLKLFTQRAQQITNFASKPIQLVLGRDYEQLAKFACQWCTHKSTKVRSAAFDMAAQLCRLNAVDARGTPFKNCIIGYILALRSSIRDPLIKKINQVCNEASQPAYLDPQEADIGLLLSSMKNQPTSEQEGLPSIIQTSLPKVNTQKNPIAQQSIVLPHSEPLSETQLQKSTDLIGLFGLQLITCFYSQTWSSRNVAILKVQEQLNQLDPNRRDAMSAEINQKNLPPEISFKTLMKFFEDGLRDPVLKNYITILNLIQQALPIYFRYLFPEEIRREMTPLIQVALNKMSDLKQKVREASTNFCLYLSHQAEIGSKKLAQLILQELEPLNWEKQGKEVQNQFGNSTMIVSCLSLLTQLQESDKFVEANSEIYVQYTKFISRALKHQNPQVRKQGETLFQVMYQTFSDDFGKQFKHLKAKLIQESKPQVPSAVVDAQVELKGCEVWMKQLQLPDPKKRIQAIVEIKKTVHQQLNSLKAREMIEPLSTLVKQLLKDDNLEVYLESLNFLKFVVGGLAQHMSSLDTHLMLGQFVSILVSQSHQGNIRMRLASDKVVVYFAKHQSIGALPVAKELLKNVDRLNRSALVKNHGQIDESQHDKRQTLIKIYNLLQMILQQFSVVLCYQQDFMTKCLEQLSDTLAKGSEEPQLKSLCTQILVCLYQIDPKVVDLGVKQVDFSKRSHLRKILIELENASQKGGQVIQPGAVSENGSKRSGSPSQGFGDTKNSFPSFNTTSMSHQVNMSRRMSRERTHRADSLQANKTIVSSESQFPRVRAENMTNASWQEKTNTLPPIEQTKTRRQLGQGYVSNAINKAAGFKNDSSSDFKTLSTRKPAPLNSDMKGVALIPYTVQKENKDEPFYYVPTQRTTLVKKTETYQPSLLAREKPIQPRHQLY